MRMSQETESHAEAQDNLDAEYGEIPHPRHNHCHLHPLTPNDDNLLTIYQLFYLKKKNGEMLLPGTSCLLLQQIRERSLEKCQPLLPEAPPGWHRTQQGVPVVFPGSKANIFSFSTRKQGLHSDQPSLTPPTQASGTCLCFCLRS